MSFVLSGTTITQTAGTTDVNPSAIGAITGVTTITDGLVTIYNLGALNLVIAGTLTIDPRTHRIIRAGNVTINTNATFNVGVQYTSVFGGGTLFSTGDALILSGVLTNNGTLNVLGSTIHATSTVAGRFHILNGTVFIRSAVVKTGISSNHRLRVQTDTVDIDGLETEGIQFDALMNPTIATILKNISPKNVGVGIENALNGGGASAQVQNFVGVPSLNGRASAFTSNWTGGYDLRLRLVADGSAVVVMPDNCGNATTSGHGARVYHNFTASVKTTLGNAIQNAIIYLKDTNNGLRKIKNAGATVIDNTANQILISSTDVNGNIPEQTLLTAHIYRNNAVGDIAAPDGNEIKDLRGKVNTAGSDLFDVHCLSYGYEQIVSLDEKMSGQTAKAINFKLLIDANVTLTEGNAITKLASSFIVDMPTNKITITANSTLDDLYDVMKVFKTRNVQSQLEYPTINTQPITANGNTLVTAMNIVGLEFLTVGIKFKNIQANCTANASFTNINVIGNVAQNTPTNLTNVSVTGILNYNIASNNSVTFTGSNATTVKNNGIGVISVKKVNSNFTNGTNITSYIPTFLNLSLNGGRILILDNLGVEKFNQTTDGIIELDSAAVGNWTYRIAKFGNKLIENTFTIDGTTKQINTSFIPDTFVNDTLLNVQGYTSLDGTQQIYDYQSYNLTTINGIKIGNKLSKGFGTLSVDGAFTTDSSQVALFSFLGGTITTKTINLLENATLIVTGNFTQNTTVLSNDIKVRALNLDSEILFTTDNVVFYPTLNDRNAGSNIGETATGGIYRYKYGNTYSGVLMTNPLHIRYNIGTTTSLDILLLTQYNYKLEITTTQLIAQVSDNLRKVNNNVINASLLIPANETF